MLRTKDCEGNMAEPARNYISGGPPDFVDAKVARSPACLTMKMAYNNLAGELGQPRRKNVKTCQNCQLLNFDTTLLCGRQRGN